MNKKITNFMYFVLIAILSLVIFSPAFIKSNPVSADNNHNTETEIIEEVDPDVELPEEIDCMVSIKNAEDVVKYAMLSFGSAMTIDSTTTGTAVTSTPIGTVTQQVYGATRVDSNGNALVINSSVKIAGPVGRNVYSLTYFDGNSVYMRDTTNVNTSFKPTFSQGWKTMTVPTYKETYGIFAGELNYTINSSTIKSFGTMKKKLIEKNNQKTLFYSTKISLDTKLSVTNYQKYVKIFSESTKIPEFSKIDLEFLIDKNGNLISYTVIESYSIKSQGFEVTINANMTTSYNDFSKYFLLEDPRK